MVGPGPSPAVLAIVVAPRDTAGQGIADRMAGQGTADTLAEPDHRLEAPDPVGVGLEATAGGYLPARQRLLGLRKTRRAEMIAP